MEHIINDGSHSALLGGTSMLETERHDFVMEITHESLEGSLLASEGSILI